VPLAFDISPPTL